MLKRLAQLISLIFGLPWLALIVYLLIFQTNLEPHQVSILAVALPILMGVIPFSYYFWGLETGRISDIDITKRSQRYGVLSVMLACNLAALWVIHTFANQALFHIALVVLCVFIVICFITLFWKISLHMTVNVIGIVLVNVLYRWEYWWLVLVIPLIFWSRLYLKKHTVAQLLAGLVVSGGIMLGGLRLFGL